MNYIFSNARCAVTGLRTEVDGIMLNTACNYIRFLGSNDAEMARFTTSNTYVANTLSASNIVTYGITACNVTYATTSNITTCNVTASNINASYNITACNLTASNISSIYNLTASNIYAYSETACNLTASNISSIYNVTASNIHAYSVTACNVTASNIAVSGSKQFDIPHPDPAKCVQNYRLKHSCVEAPSRGDNLYRYALTTTTAGEHFSLELPSYWTYLNENPQAFISAVDTPSWCFATVGGASVTGACQLPGSYNILVFGTRKDPNSLGFDVNGVEYITA